MYETIDEMKAGRELDALVAERVMGLSVKYMADSWALSTRGNWVILDADGKPKITAYLSGNEYPQLVPRYSTEIECAWDVLLQWKSWNLERTFGGHILCRIGDDHEGMDPKLTSEGEAKEAPLAICRATLRQRSREREEKK